MTLLLVVFIFILLLLGAAMVMIWYLNRGKDKSVQNSIEFSHESEEVLEITHKKPDKNYQHISELINTEVVEPGIYYTGGKYLGLARIEGTNFSILSDGEIEAREDMLIAIQNQIKYPVQYITSTIVTDTDREVEKIQYHAGKTTNHKVSLYCKQYIMELENMKQERRAMAKVSWLVISGDDKLGAPGNPVQRIKERMALLQETFRSRAGIIMTPLTSTEEVVDAFQQIMQPEKLVKPSEVARLCMHPIKFNIKEIADIAT